ncbi:MAG: ABC transporter permease [Lachnospiraceae bacterium]|nr:ABC transporter permease [Lachnospiraceae bacterium]
MRFIDLIKMGARNLLRRKARTLLTVIGVIIGTISIVVMISIGIGMNRSFEESIMENGSMTVIQVSAYSYYQDDDGNWTEKKQELNDKTIKQLKEIEHVKCVTPIIYGDAQLVAKKNYQSWLNLMVMDMDCYEEFGYPALEDGTYPNKANSKDAVYFGSQMYLSFGYFNGSRYVEKEIDFDRDKVELQFQRYEPNPKKKPFSYQLKNIQHIAQSDSGYSMADYYAFMDIDTYYDLYEKYANTLKLNDRKKALEELKTYQNIMINVDNMNNVTDVQDEIEKLGLKSESEMQYIKPMQDTAKMLELILGAIGGVAMLVSAINIANTMIMSIYERTREIGIMKVLGCKVGDVKKLFLFEAGLMGFIGGTIGVGLSYIVSWLMNKYGGDIFSGLMGGGYYGGTTSSSAMSIIPFWLPFFAAGFGILVGLISGFFPALRATRISAIEAMKNE